MGARKRANHPSHDTVSDFLRSQYGSRQFSLLDLGVMSGVTYDRTVRAGLSVEYTGIDIGEALLDDCRSRYPEATWLRMSATDISFAGNSFDVVNCRHLLESLPYYETALREAFRVAREHVVVCMGHPPLEPEVLLRRETANGYIWLNRYAPGPFEALLESLSESVVSSDVTAEQTTHRIYFCTKKRAT
jgi:ubiquinone/menaquinone biosynthesis C-methylase UbiE